MLWKYSSLNPVFRHHLLTLLALLAAMSVLMFKVVCTCVCVCVCVCVSGVLWAGWKGCRWTACEGQQLRRPVSRITWLPYPDEGLCTNELVKQMSDQAKGLGVGGRTWLQQLLVDINPPLFSNQPSLPLVPPSLLLSPRPPLRALGVHLYFSPPVPISLIRSSSRNTIV